MGDEADAVGETEQDTEHEISAIISHRQQERNGAYEFLVQWYGYDSSYNEWVKEENITSCPLLLQYKEDQIATGWCKLL